MIEKISLTPKIKKCFLFKTLRIILREITIVEEVLILCIISPDLTDREKSKENIHSISNALFEIHKLTEFEKLVYLLDRTSTCLYRRA